MTDAPDPELVIARLLSDQQSADATSLTDEQATQLAKAAQGLKALTHLAGENTAFALPETVNNTDRTFPGVEGNNLPAEQIGRFQIKGTLGVGGHGLVFLAFDPKLEREVALKIPNMNAALDQESQQRFIRESRAAAVLSHPSIVPVFESGNIGPINYIVYRYCPGTNLATWSKQHSLKETPLQAAKIVAQLSDAVEHAHQRGIIHRDLKPSNVLLESELQPKELTADQLPGCLRIADFGLAKFISDNTSLTQTRGVVGTPDYMSPEQASGSPDVDASSDVYALGAILYELLTGHPPHKKDTLLATLKAVANDPIIPPRKINPGVTRDLNSICLKCLEKSASNRYGSAFALAEDLRAVLESRPVSVSQPTVVRRLDRWMRRNPILVRAAAATAIISLVVLGIALYLVNNARQDEHVANQAAQANLQRAREIVKDFFVMTEGELEDLPGDSIIRKRLATRSVRYFEEFEKLVDSQDQQSLEDLALVRARLGRILDSDNQFNEAIQHFNTALREFRTLSQIDSLTDADRLKYQFQIARLHVDLGSAHMNLTENETGSDYNLKAIEALRELDSTHSQTRINDQLVNALIDRSTILSVFGETDEAQQVQHEAMSLIGARTMTPSLQRKQAFLHMEMAKTFAVREELRKSIEQYQNARKTFLELAAHTRQNQFLNLMAARCDVRIVGLRRRIGQPNQQSIQDHRIIVEQMKKLATENPERSVYQHEYALGLFDLALMHSKAEQLKNAIKINKELIQFIESTKDRLGNLDAEANSLLGGSYNNLASCYMQTTQFGLAEETIRSAIRNTRAALELEPNNLSAQRFLINHYHGLGEILAALDRPLEAVAALEDAANHSQTFCDANKSNITSRKQLYSILDKRINLLEGKELRKLTLENIQRRVSESIVLLRSDPRYHDYYERELEKDVRRLVGVVLDFHQADAESRIAELLESTSQRSQLRAKLLKAINDESEKRQDAQSAACLRKIRNLLIEE